MRTSEQKGEEGYIVKANEIYKIVYFYGKKTVIIIIPTRFQSNAQLKSRA